jgi:hypothetical protein
VPLALGRPRGRQASGFVVSHEPPASKTVEESGRRLDIDEHCWADTSQGFPLESSLIRSAHAFERLGGGLAIPTLSLVAQGPAVVPQGQRRGVDAPGCHGQSSLNMGWKGDETCPPPGV